MVGDTSVLIQASPLSSETALAMTITWMREFFNEEHLPQPPLPKNVLVLAPCALLVTETQGNGGLRMGKIKLTDPDGGVLYESDWLIAPARS